MWTTLYLAQMENGIALVSEQFKFIWLFSFLGIFIVAAKRTPFGAFGGKLKNISATELQAVANKAAIESSGLCPEHISTVHVGNVMQVCGFDCLLN